MCNLDASGFQFAETIYEIKFQRVLFGFIKCYQLMLLTKVSVPNNENEIRDMFLSKEYLKGKSFKEKQELDSYLFDKETSEDSGGIADIRVLPINPLRDDDAYYLIECKRLNDRNTDGKSGLNGEYIKNGIMRFTSNKYSAYYGISGMIGFVVEKMDICNNTSKINTLLNSKFKNANTIDELTKKSLNKFPYCYQSKHKDSQEKTIDIYHLMLDFSDNITPSIKK